VVEVLAMTTPATLLIAYDGEQEVDAWLNAISDCLATRRTDFRTGPVRRTSARRRFLGEQRP
jgi:hypothetical protein